MSGHSKWAQIKRKKGAADQKRGQIFTKIGRLISLAAKEGGGDHETNFKLRLAIQKAKEVNMPKESIERAIKRGTGELGGEKIEEVIYEASGPSGIALIIEAVTDNRNRTTAEIRNILNRHRGKMAGAGSFKWLFEQNGLIRIKGSGEELELKIIDIGAEDFEEDEGEILIYTKPQELFNIKKQLENEGIEVISSEISLEPKEIIKIENQDDAETILKLMEDLENNDDVTKVYSNFDIKEEIIEKIS